MKLGELLVNSNMITVTQLQQALKAQQIYGGKLGTNLVELGLITETQLTQFLAKQLNLPAAQPGDFTQISPEVLALIPKDFAKQYGVIPLAFQNRKLKVAFSDPLDLDAREKTSFRVGHSIIPVIAPELLINYGLEKFYGVPNEKRYLKMGDDDEGSFDDLLTRNQMDALASDEIDTGRSRLLKSAGQYTLENLSLDLFQASTKEHVFHSLFRFFEPNFTQMAVFVQRQNEVWGWTQQGFNLDNKQFRSKVGMVGDASTLAEVFSRRDLVWHATLQPVDRKTLEWLGGDPAHSYNLLPMLVGSKVLAMFLVTHGQVGPIGNQAQITGPIQDALTKGAIALQMVNLRRKLLVKS